MTVVKLWNPVEKLIYPQAFTIEIGVYPQPK